MDTVNEDVVAETESASVETATLSEFERQVQLSEFVLHPLLMLLGKPAVVKSVTTPVVALD